MNIIEVVTTRHVRIINHNENIDILILPNISERLGIICAMSCNQK
jgi:hypothetical protein